MKKIYTLTFAWLLALGSHAQSEPTAVPLTAENFIITSTENREAALGPVSLLELGTEATLLDIPETVEIEGETYAVTAVLGPVTGGVTVAEGRKIKVDSIGVSKTVRSIGERAFNIERSLKTMSLGFGPNGFCPWQGAV